MIRGMSKKKPPADEQPPDKKGGKKQYPSRANTKYLAVPKRYYEALEKYAAEHSDEDDEKSVSWAARVAIRAFLTEAGLWPPPADADDSSSTSRS